MFRSYFKTAWRNLWHNKFFSAIKILGLSIGLMVCLVIFLYTKDELSYDRFHQNGHELFRIVQAWQIGKDQDQHIGTTNRILGETIRKEVPEVLEAIHINGTQVTVKNANDEVFTESPMFVDENFFNVFSFSIDRWECQNRIERSIYCCAFKGHGKEIFSRRCCARSRHPNCDGQNHSGEDQ